MDELKQILTHKLKLIQTYRNHTPVSPQERQQLTELFLKQKRKENSRDVIESRLIQTLATRKIQAPYRVEEFYGHSLQMMQMYSPGFEVSGKRDQRDMMASVVGLYVEFFQKNECGRRAEEIRHIVEKNLCERNMLIPTIFNWFAEWLRKAFKQFIKRTLNQYNEHKNASVALLQQNKKSRNRKFMEELNVQRASLSLIDSEIKLHKMKELNLSGKRSKLLSPNKAEIKTARNVSKSELLSYCKSNQFLSLVKLNPAENSPEKELILPHAGRESTEPQKQKQKSAIYLNKDIFFSAFYEEINSYYKLHGDIGDLDQNYPRNFRKVDRREEINKNLNVLVKSMTRNQPAEIKESIDGYYEGYKGKFGAAFEKELQKARAKVRKRAESVDIYKEPTASQSKKTNRSFDQQQQKKPSPMRQSAEKKKIQLQLPTLKLHPHSSNLHKSAQKLIIINNDVPLSRYSRAKNRSERVSAQLYKELREINSLFKHRSPGIRESLQILDKDLFQVKSNSIKFRNRGNGDEVGELLDGHFEENGIFRLPKICR